MPGDNPILMNSGKSNSASDASANSHVLLVGVGNETRTDDGLGIFIAREYRRRALEGVCVVELSGEGTSLATAWNEHTDVFLVDAVVSGQTPGTLHRCDASSGIIPKQMFRSSSHMFGVAEGIELARQLKMLPRSLVLYGIEAESFEEGSGLSECVVRSIPELLRMLDLDLERIFRTEG